MALLYRLPVVTAPDEYFTHDESRHGRKPSADTRPCGRGGDALDSRLAHRQFWFYAPFMVSTWSFAFERPGDCRLKAASDGRATG